MVITVACVLKSGGVYSPDFVSKLRRGVERHLTLPHRFVCLSDIDVDCERIPLIHDWRGWWSKIELFREGLFNGTVLYVDLDSVVVGDLDCCFEYQHKFSMAHEFYRPSNCSTAMCWSGDYSIIYDKFKTGVGAYSQYYDIEAPRKNGRIGDQAFIEDTLTHAGHGIEQFRHVISDKFVASYKVDKCKQQPVNGSSIVAFHGRPKPQDIKSGWVLDQWQ